MVELLTGANPFTAETSTEINEKITNQDCLKTLPDHISPNARDLISKVTIIFQIFFKRRFCFGKIWKKLGNYFAEIYLAKSFYFCR